MSARDMIVEAGILATKAGNKTLEEQGLTDKARQICRCLNELALELLMLAREIES